MVSLSRRRLLALAPALALPLFASATLQTEPIVLRLLSDAQDFSDLGLSTQIEPWEDGRRTPQSETHFEWWYLDAMLDDGTILVGWLGDNWSYGTRTRAVNLEISRPGERTRLQTGRNPQSRTSPAASVESGGRRCYMSGMTSLSMNAHSTLAFAAIGDHSRLPSRFFARLFASDGLLACH